MHREEIESCLAAEEVDLSALRQLSRTKDGFIDHKLRRAVWPKLLCLSAFDYTWADGRAQLIDGMFDYRRLIDQQHPDKDQVELDIKRSLFNIDQLKAWDVAKLDNERQVISNHIMAILSQERDLHYFQGFHDVVSVLVLVLGSHFDKDEDGDEADVLSQQLLFRVVERVSMTYFRDCARSDFKSITNVMTLVLDLVRDQDAELYSFLREAEVPPFFATSWVITWWAHELKDLSKAARVFDVLLSSPPYYILYLCAAYLLVMSEKIQQEECEFAFVHNALSRGVSQWGFPVLEVIEKADKLFVSSSPLSSPLSSSSSMFPYQRGGLWRLHWSGRIAMFDPLSLQSPWSPYNAPYTASDTYLISMRLSSTSGSDRRDSQKNKNKNKKKKKKKKKARRRLEQVQVLLEQARRRLQASFVACLEVVEFLLFLDVSEEEDSWVLNDADAGVAAHYYQQEELHRPPLYVMLTLPFRRVRRRMWAAARDRRTLLWVCFGFLGGLSAWTTPGWVQAIISSAS